MNNFSVILERRRFDANVGIPAACTGTVIFFSTIWNLYLSIVLSHVCVPGCFWMSQPETQTITLQKNTGGTYYIGIQH